MAVKVDYRYQHNKNILSENVTSKPRLGPGNIVMFNYKGEKSTRNRPLVLILNPNWKGELHGLNLDVINESTLNELYNIVKESKMERVRKLLKINAPFLRADIQDPRKFYETRLKKFIKREFSRGESPYRTYKTNKITTIRQIDYRFKDMAKPGQE